MPSRSWLAGLLVASALLGCGAVDPNPEPAPAAAPDPGPEKGALLPELPAALPDRVKALQPGMTPDEVKAILGPEVFARVGETGGPAHRLRTRIPLGDGGILTLTFDHGQDREGRLVSAQLAGPQGSEKGPE